MRQARSKDGEKVDSLGKGVMKLVIDLQILQTPARFRGMGQYLVSLVEAFQSQPSFGEIEEVHFLFTDNLPIEQSLTAKVKQLLPDAQISALPLLTLNDEDNTQQALNENKNIVDEWISSKKLENSVFCIPSIFQTEIYPVFPSQPRKCALAYDLIPLQMHARYSCVMRWKDYLYRFSEMYAAEVVLCISKTTSNAMQIYAGVPATKLKLINGGPATFPKPQKPNFEIKGKFILMPTGNDIRKNNHNAIVGFDLFNQAEGRDYTLVVTSHFTDSEVRSLSDLSPNIVFTQTVKDEELAWLYKNCAAVLFPSTLEGLGMPLLEGLVYDKPVVASRIDVLEEISEKIPYYFNPFDPVSISKSLDTALYDLDFKNRQKDYAEIIKTYSWDQSASLMMEALAELDRSKKTVNNKKTIAVLCPLPSGISAVGKFVAEMHPALAELADVDYYFEPPTLTKELRPNIIGVFAPNWHVSHFNKRRYDLYDGVIYHIGNGNHHSITMACALTMPGAVVLHDLNIENIFNDLLETKKIDKNRYALEVELNKRGTSKSNFITSLVNRQKSVIVHSDYAKSVIEKLIDNNESTQVVKANLPVHTPEYMIETTSEDKFTIGLAGILANIKGLEVIEAIAENPLFRLCNITLFGLNFAEPGSLERLQQLPNVEVATNLSDYEFQERLKELSVFVNYRKKYQGEASSATLEAMRYGIPVIVRSDFGWYSELPDDAVIKVDKEEDIAGVLTDLINNPGKIRIIGNNARKATKQLFSVEDYVEKLLEAIEISK